ncbi:MAG: hypothetical protein M1827_000882 [Pycnora praestabilis]|nr:MAG: hypothetical protein M1827_000882 [Pycnora praestabilis]
MNLADDIYDSEDALPHSPRLQAVKVKRTPSLSPPPFINPLFSSPSTMNVSTRSSNRSSKRSGRRRKTQPSQSDAVLVSSMDPNRPDIAREAARRALNSASQSEASDSEMDIDDREEEPTEVRETSDAQSLVTAAQQAVERMRGMGDGDDPLIDEPMAKTASESQPEDQTQRFHTAPAAEPVEEIQPNGTSLSPSRAGSSRMEVDSRIPVPKDALNGLLSLKEQSPKSHLLKSPPRATPNSLAPEESLATSPTLRDHAISISEGSPHQTLPRMQAQSPSHPNASASEKSLPSLHSHLTQLAEAAEKEAGVQPYDNRSNGVIPLSRQSFSSAGGGPGQSPPKASAGSGNQDRHIPSPFVTNQQRQGLGKAPQQPINHQARYPTNHSSPASAFSGTSPDDTYRQGRELPNLSPPDGISSLPPAPYYWHRRTSQANEIGPPYAATPVSGAPTGSTTTTESHPSTESFSPSTNPTPGDRRMSVDGGPPAHSMMPQHQTGQLPAGGFKCEYAGCPAAPFQTQYLLNSHANVHSQNRPHYCPVRDCPRGEGGKGFKRKNEMIRHGLVHDSPGYVCPFCPDREHRYPRPDNLQRHVRVHHMDKDKDDPQLREVLAQRPEGGNRGRRRRLGP